MSETTLVFMWYINSKTATEAFQRKNVLSTNYLAGLPYYLMNLRRSYSSSAVNKNLSHLKKKKRISAFIHQSSQNHIIVEVGKDFWRSCDLTLPFKQGHSEPRVDTPQPPGEICASAQPPSQWNIFPNFHVDPSVFQFMPTASYPVNGHHWEKSISIFCASSLQVFAHINRIPSEPSLLLAEH